MKRYLLLLLLVLLFPGSGQALFCDGVGTNCGVITPPPPPPPPAPPPAPPPPPPAAPPPQAPPTYYELGAGDFQGWEEQVWSMGFVSRCKIQNWRQNFDQLGVSLLRVVTMEGTFRVCYTPNQGIISFSDVHGDAVSTRIPWTWRGIDPGYPYGISYGRSVDFHYRGTALICIVGWACGPEKHPWVRISFYDNNTMVVRAGVA